MQTPLVSIIIPTYNREKFIVQTLDSLLHQQYINWESLVVDDGSSDTTKQKVLAFVKNDKRIKFFEREKSNKGASVCRNIGLQKASGEFVIYLDSDDLLAEWCIAERVKKMLENPELDFAVFHAKTFTHKIDDGHLHTTGITTQKPLYHFLAGHCIWQTMCPIWKKDFLIALGGFDEDFQRFQDAEFHVRALLAKELQYKIFAEMKYDCYYRLEHEKRSEEFWDKVVSNNILFISKMTSLARSRTEAFLFNRSITIVATFGVAFSLRSNKNKASEFLSFIRNLKDKEILAAPDFKMLTLFLSAYKKRLFDKYFGVRIANRILIASAEKQLKKL